tara:strand:+ start:81950 stop:83719 length:1770 start_codon:yes stop_codon:yes gene_type:complete
MRIIVYSETNAATVGGNLGLAEYSYYFVLKKYLPVLERLGEVVHVEDPQLEVDALFEQAAITGEPSVFLSFTPPNRTVRGLKCPTVCVLAWEFDNIPNESWDIEDPWQNWVLAIQEIGYVLTISDYATRIIRHQVGSRPRVETVPAPVDSRVVAGGNGQDPLATKAGGPGHRTLALAASIYDTEALDIDFESVTARAPSADGSGTSVLLWDGHAADWDFFSTSETPGPYLVGFYVEESWGSWSKTARPSVNFPWSIVGEVELAIELVGYGANQGRTVSANVGSQVIDIVLPAALEVIRLNLTLDMPVDNIYFTGLITAPEEGAREHRTLGLGLRSMSLRRSGAGDSSTEVPRLRDNDARKSATTLDLSGTVYASVFNPADGRKNWFDIVTAFCWAFKERADKTLILKMSHHNRSTFLGDLFLLFSSLAPFKCRVIAIHGYLSDDELAALVAVTDFFVTASTAEGQCLPLLEFMAEGVPAISPKHTAMETYINSDNAFVVSSSHEPHIWPNDPRKCYRTLSNRIDWDSLRQAYCDSASVLLDEPKRYALMSAASRSVVEKHYSSQEVEKRLRKFLRKTARPRRWWHVGGM